MEKLILILKTNWLIFLILILALVIRSYNFKERITFGPEQAISLLVSADYTKEKFSLLGLPSTQRTTSQGHIIYYPPVFNYALVPLLAIFNYQVVPVTYFFALLNVLTGFLIYFQAGKIFKEKLTGIFAAIIFLFNDLMINHSLFIWSVNFLPFFSILIMYNLFKVYKKKASPFDIFLAGLLSSFSLGVEYLFLGTGFFILAFILFFSKEKISALFLFLAGGLIGLLPTIIFDLTHEGYHIKTLYQYFLDTILNPSQSKITYYHFLHFWPLFALILGLLIFKIFNRSKYLAFLLILAYAVFNLSSSKVSFSNPVGMYPNLNYEKIEKAAEIIASDNPSDFNVVMTFDFDSRAHPLRYLLEYNYGLKPLGVEDYPDSKLLYIFTTQDYPVKTSRLWEISSFNAGSIERIGEIDEFLIYKSSK